MEVNGDLVRRKDETLPPWKRIGPEIFFDTLPRASKFHDDNRDENIFYMPAKELESDDSYCFCLLLQLLDRDAGVYQRLGITVTVVQEEQDTLMATIPGQDEYPSLSYEDGLHTVRIV
jgi:hypothetical protein